MVGSKSLFKIHLEHLAGLRQTHRLWEASNLCPAGHGTVYKKELFFFEAKSPRVRSWYWEKLWDDYTHQPPPTPTFKIKSSHKLQTQTHRDLEALSSRTFFRFAAAFECAPSAGKQWSWCNTGLLRTIWTLGEEGRTMTPQTFWFWTSISMLWTSIFHGFYFGILALLPFPSSFPSKIRPSMMPRLLWELVERLSAKSYGEKSSCTGENTLLGIIEMRQRGFIGRIGFLSAVLCHQLLTQSPTLEGSNRGALQSNSSFWSEIMFPPPKSSIHDRWKDAIHLWATELEETSMWRSVSPKFLIKWCREPTVFTSVLWLTACMHGRIFWHSVWSQESCFNLSNST